MMNSKVLSKFVAESLFSKASLALYLFVRLFLFTGRFFPTTYSTVYRFLVTGIII